MVVRRTIGGEYERELFLRNQGSKLIMNKKFALMVFTSVFLLLVIIRVQFITSASVDPAIIRVPKNYSTIQEAINAASSGDIILVAAGTYYEHLTINKSLTLIGEDKSNTIIDGNGTDSVMRITSGNVNISGFTVQNSGNSSLLDSGIFIESNSSGNTISGNTITSNDYGILLNHSSGNVISNNHISNNEGGFPGLLWGGGICLSYGSNNTISDNIMTNNLVSVILCDSSNNTIVGNVLSNKLVLSNSNGNIISNNMLYGPSGILLYDSSRNIISNDTIIANKMLGGEGIRLMDSNGNTVVGNAISGSYMGDYTGFDLRMADNNTIVGNTVSDCAIGIVLDDCRDNIIYNNNFINNIEQVEIVSGWFITANVWDAGYPSGGNYWSNYTGLDVYGGPYQNETGSDGIGDIPHILDENNTDNCPLMGMFSDFPVTLGEETHHVTTVCNSIVSAFHFNQPAGTIGFNVSGPDGTVGFCRVMFPGALLGEGPYNVTVDGLPPLTLKELPISNGTHVFLYFTYVHSTREVKIFPEFPAALIIPLLIVTALLATILRRMIQPARKPHHHTSDTTS